MRTAAGSPRRSPGTAARCAGTEFALSAGPTPDRLLLGLAVLGLVSAAAEDQPRVCLIDDLQWLDRASMEALSFVARRLGAETVALIMATVLPTPDSPSYRRWKSAVCAVASARALLDLVWTAPLDERVRDQFVAETRGNPLALLELPRDLTDHELAGGFGMPSALRLSGRIEESFQHRLASLPEQSRRLLLIAAAEPTGDPALVWRAAARLGIGVDAATPVISDGLAEFGIRVRFRHPLVRIGDIPICTGFGKAAGTPSVRRRDGSGHRSRPPCVAPGPCGRGTT